MPVVTPKSYQVQQVQSPNNPNNQDVGNDRDVVSRQEFNDLQRRLPALENQIISNQDNKMNNDLHHNNTNKKEKKQTTLLLMHKSYLKSNQLSNNSLNSLDESCDDLTNEEKDVLTTHGIHNFNFDSLRGHTISEIIDDIECPINRVLLHKIDSINGTISLYCIGCSRYYPCSKLSRTSMCCPMHSFICTTAEMDDYLKAGEFIDYFKSHIAYKYHRRSEARWWLHDQRNRQETFRQVLNIYNLSLKSTDDVVYELCEYGHAESNENSSANTNQCVHRVGEVQELLVNAIRLNYSEYIFSPSISHSGKKFRFITIMSDTYGKGKKKGEMSNTVTRDNCEWKGGVLGWHPWKYSKDKTVIKMKDKASFIVENMEKFNVVPTDLSDDDIDVHVVVVGVSGDKLYENIIKPINDHLKQRYNGKRIIHTSLTGKKAHWDDCHANEKGYKASIVGDAETKAGNKFVKEVSNYPKHLISKTA